jgi:hypothetical protein
VSVSCVQTRKGDILLDPVSSEEASTFAVSSYDFTINTSRAVHEDNLLNASCSGCFSVEEMKSALDVCNGASVNIDKAIKGYVAGSM